MVAWLPPLAFALSWLFALVGLEPFGTPESAPFDEKALRWMLLISGGCALVGNAIPHTLFARQTAEAIGWESNGFQYELGFASLAMGFAGIYASTVDEPSAWVVGSIGAGVFLLLAGLNHLREIIGERNYAPGSTVILISDFGVPISLFALLVATGAI